MKDVEYSEYALLFCALMVLNATYFIQSIVEKDILGLGLSVVSIIVWSFVFFLNSKIK